MIIGAIGEPHGRLVERPRRNCKKSSRDAAFVHAKLARIIEAEILPRLQQPHQRELKAKPLDAPAPSHERVAAFARSLIDREPDTAQAEKLLNEGLPLDTLLLDLLAPAARYLGRMWEEDEANFFDVTIGLGRLHGLARTLCARLEAVSRPANGRSVFLMPCPGETHLFSLALVASFFREAGWSVTMPSDRDDDPVALLRNESFDLIGISLSCDVLLPSMTEFVAELRASSYNFEVRVMVGGPLFLRDPTCAATLGADAAAEDGRSAVRVAEALFTR